MTNPIIDAINWDVNNPGASAILLKQQLALLQAEWDEKTSRILQLKSVGPKSISSFQDLLNHRNGEIDNYLGFDPADELVDSNLRYVRGELVHALPYAGTGHKERIYLEQTSVLTPNLAVDTTFLYTQTVSLPRPAFVRGFHPLILKSATAFACRNLFRPQIDGTAIYSGNPTGGAAGDARPGILFWPLVMSTETFVIVEWATPDVVDAGSHTFRMDIISNNGLGGSLSAANVAPFFDIYTSAIEVGTMPTTYVQPSLSYLEFIYT